MELLAGFDALQISVAIIATLAAAFVRGLAGFGLAILIVPILALTLSPVEAVLLTNCMALMLGVLEIPMIRRHAEKSALTISVLVALTTLPGLMLLAATPPNLARFLIALVALSAFLAVLFPVRPAKPPGKAATGLVGVSSGLLTGFAGMPGPPVVPYYVGRAIPREMAKASMVAIFSVAATAGIVSGAAIGVLEWRLVGLAALLFPVVLLGNWLGSMAMGRISDRLWRAFAGSVLAGAALAALLRLI